MSPACWVVVTHQAWPVLAFSATMAAEVGMTVPSDSVVVEPSGSAGVVTGCDFGWCRAAVWAVGLFPDDVPSTTPTTAAAVMAPPTADSVMKPRRFRRTGAEWRWDPDPPEGTSGRSGVDSSTAVRARPRRRGWP